MQKQLTLLAVALATGLILPLQTRADNANISIYGRADVSLDLVQTGTAANGTPGVRKSNVSSNVSRVGFKGSEDLGDSLSAIWQIEQQINIDNTGGTFATRNSFVGLKGDGMGTVLMGRHDTPYKLATRKLDAFADTIADNRALLGGVTSNTTVDSANTAFDGRQPDILYYSSPNLDGFSGSVAYANLTEANTTAAAARNSLFSLAGMYDIAPFYGSVAFERHKLATVIPGGKESALKVGFGYTVDAFTLGLVYEKTKDNLTAGTGANLYGHNAYSLSGAYKIGAGAIKLAYGKAGQHGTTADTGANQISAGYEHGLSKRTKLYAVYSRIRNNPASDYRFTQSSAAAGTINGIGASPSAISLGVQHNF